MQPLATEHALAERRLVGIHVVQQVVIVVLRADVEAAGEERGRHADLRYEARRLAEQQRDDSEQHQLCMQAWFLYAERQSIEQLASGGIDSRNIKQVVKSETMWQRCLKLAALQSQYCSTKLPIRVLV